MDAWHCGRDCERWASGAPVIGRCDVVSGGRLPGSGVDGYLRSARLRIGVDLAGLGCGVTVVGDQAVSLPLPIAELSCTLSQQSVGRAFRARAAACARRPGHDLDVRSARPGPRQDPTVGKISNRKVLTSAIRVMYQSIVVRSAPVDDRLQRVRRQVGAQVPGQLPADDPVAEDVGDERDVRMPGCPGSKIARGLVVGRRDAQVVDGPQVICRPGRAAIETASQPSRMGRR